MKDRPARDTRMIVALSLLALFAALVASRYIQLAVASIGNPAVAEAVEGERGVIADRQGRVLAMDIPKYDISIWRPATNPASFRKEIPELERMLGLKSGFIEEKYENKSLNYFYVAKRVSSEAAAKLREAKNAGRFAGVQIDEIAGRLYPEGELAAKLIGFTGEGNRGLDGVEIKYDAELLPKKRESKEAGASVVPKGDTIYLTIDANLQFQLEKILERARVANKAESAFALAMDVNTGEILAYVDQPEFDPNRYFDFSAGRRSDALTLYSYEPGSVFKVFSMSSILDIGAITPNTVIDCDGAYRKTLPSGEQIVIKDLGVYGKQNLAGILAHSSNAGVGYASDRISDIDLYERLSAFGFGSKTGIGLSGESPGSLREPTEWSGRSKPTIAIGQEVMVTPVQIITAAAAVANGGFLLRPATVKRIVSADGEVVYSHETQVVRRVMQADTSKSIVSAMESAASMDGTGWRAKVSDVRMAVKTGTAQMIDPTTRRYSDTDYIASTLGIFPADNPRIALYIVLVKPQGASYLGGQIAAPVLREASEAVLSTLDIPRGKSDTVLHGGSIIVKKEAEASIGDTMPDLKGYSKRSLLPLLLKEDIGLVIRGEGYVVSQSPAPGTPVTPGTKVTLVLE